MTFIKNPIHKHFFEDLWEYSYSGRNKNQGQYNLYPQYPITGAGERGGVGRADLAIGLLGIMKQAFMLIKRHFSIYKQPIIMHPKDYEQTRDKEET